MDQGREEDAAVGHGVCRSRIDDGHFLVSRLCRLDGIAELRNLLGGPVPVLDSLQVLTRLCCRLRHAGEPVLQLLPKEILLFTKCFHAAAEVSATKNEV